MDGHKRVRKSQSRDRKFQKWTFFLLTVVHELKELSVSLFFVQFGFFHGKPIPLLPAIWRKSRLLIFAALREIPLQQFAKRWGQVVAGESELLCEFLWRVGLQSGHFARIRREQIIRY